MIRGTTALLFCSLLFASGADAAGWPLPVLSRRDTPPVVLSPAQLQADLKAKAGTDTVYFSGTAANLDAGSITTLNYEVQWLLANPTVTVRLEGHGAPQDTRNFALAIGEKRAGAVRDYLVLHGIAADRLTVTSWGKERPGTVRNGATTVLVGPRVVTVVTASGGPTMLGSR